MSVAKIEVAQNCHVCDHSEKKLLAAFYRFGTRQHSQYISLLCTISRSQFTSHIVILRWFIITIQRETILYKIVLYFCE